MYCVDDLYQKHGEQLGLKLISGENGLRRKISLPEAQRPGLSLCGYLKSHARRRILVFGKVETEYLRDLDQETRMERLKNILLPQTPAVIVARNYRPPHELLLLCEEFEIPLFRAKLATMNLLSRLTLKLMADFASRVNRHGTLVEVFGVGVLIEGESSVGKSEAALGLLERGHRLISDDVVKISKFDSNCLEGEGVALTRHHMEIRGIGIINVAHLYGVTCVRDKKNIDLIVRLETWNDTTFYDRIGLDENNETILGVPIPCHILPVKPGRDVVLLLETIALNHRLKKMGYNSAKEFSAKLLKSISLKQMQRTKL
ncbi:HPr kinase/phosphorylase [Simkania negevensis]|uniref:HPr kinase/phosphorylase n=1 Tax=Simkania negevensis TaxID=83561 RepID=A0ABS3AQ12_9BACT|nr:HPr kinase/phosphorylase [Simkania negevensis]